MNLKELKELIELVSEKGFAEFEIERQGFRMRICRSKEPAAQLLPPHATPVIISAPISAPAAAHETPVEAAQSSAPASSSEQAEPAAADSDLQIIKSPIVGTFYRAPSPNSEPFVKVGDHVEQDTVVCIIEAMKLMNEILAEMNGEIVKIFAENGQPVEYGQPLFGIRA